MKWIPDPFVSDRVELSLIDIFKLLIGRTIKDGACEISIKQ